MMKRLCLFALCGDLESFRSVSGGRVWNARWRRRTLDPTRRVGLTVLVGALAAGLACTVSLNRAVPRAGDLDPSFGTGGKVTTGFDRDVEVRAVAIQPDGKILVGGRAGVKGSNDFALVRYNPDGTPDATFGPARDGKIVTDFGAGDDRVDSVLILPDGKILAGGHVAGESPEEFGLARYLPSGDLDVSFGIQGKVTTDFCGGNDGVHDLKLLPSGKILAAGTGMRCGTRLRSFALVRYNPDGLDTTFGPDRDGKVAIDFGENSDDRGREMDIQPDGKIVLVGWSTSTANPKGTFALARFDPDGNIDRMFGRGDGKVVGLLPGGADPNWSVVIQHDGMILVGGSVILGSTQNFVLARYSPEGTLDAGFGAGGMVIHNAGGVNSDFARIKLQPDGKIVAAGGAGSKRTKDFALARYLANGTLDPTFATAGLAITDFGGSEAVFDMALQPDGKIVAVGESVMNTGNYFVLARYNGVETPGSAADSRAR